MHDSAEERPAAYRAITAERSAEACAKGTKIRHFFPHRFHFLPKCGPDGFWLAERMCGTTEPSACWEILLYAVPPEIDEFPADLFFDDDILWHQQHFGRIGQVAAVDLAIDGSDLYTMAHQSDLVQRISRRRVHKTRIDNLFKGWHHMLLNAIVNFAIERGLKRIFSPTSAFAMRHTDRKRTVKPELFERIYDHDVLADFPAEKANDRWWAIDVEAARPRAVLGTRAIEPVRVPERTVCLCHDVERGLGHVAIDPAFAALADRAAPGHLDEMLAIEDAAAVRATYNVVGILFDELRPRIDGHGHCLAFHSYDHAVDANGDGAPQLERCRRVDYRIKGYRVPRSKPTAELTERNLCLRNFEWIASSGAWRKLPEPVMSSRLVTVPIWSDDFPLHSGQMRYPDWERAMLERVEQNRFTALSMHDCYAAHWLPHYRDFLRRLCDLAELRTVDEVAFDVILRSGV